MNRSLALAAAALLLGAWREADAPAMTRASMRPPAVSCRSQSIAGALYRICEIPASEVGRLRLVSRDAGRPVGTIARLDAIVRQGGGTLLFATNSGIYETLDRPTGLLVADGGTEYAPLNEAPGPPNPCTVANFYCPPNGVFYVADGRAGVLSTAHYAARARSGLRPGLASQSGPMLVEEGRPARDFGFSRKTIIRSGVGVRSDGTVIFAIADHVTMGAFSAAFLNPLHCRDALYLDGNIPLLYVGSDPAIPAQGSGFAAMFMVADPPSAP